KLSYNWTIEQSGQTYQSSFHLDHRDNLIMLAGMLREYNLQCVGRRHLHRKEKKSSERIR
ncbi:hypothetical protein ACDH60_27850, partial [Pseudomonas ficuserectae]|uniref:hypothetical protein n=2 Tax=Pseudomonas syringae group genomosp. 2 TaxID=251698 RepID=UPI003531C7CA